VSVRHIQNLLLSWVRAYLALDALGEAGSNVSLFTIGQLICCIDQYFVTGYA